MNKCVCDICRENDAVKQFKIKQLKNTVWQGHHIMKWIKLDICLICYFKLIDAKSEAKADE